MDQGYIEIGLISRGLFIQKIDNFLIIPESPIIITQRKKPIPFKEQGLGRFVPFLLLHSGCLPFLELLLFPLEKLLVGPGPPSHTLKTLKISSRQPKIKCASLP